MDVDLIKFVQKQKGNLEESIVLKLNNVAELEEYKDELDELRSQLTTAFSQLETVKDKHDYIYTCGGISQNLLSQTPIIFNDLREFQIDMLLEEVDNVLWQTSVGWEVHEHLKEQHDGHVDNNSYYDITDLSNSAKVGVSAYMAIMSDEERCWKADYGPDSEILYLYNPAKISYKEIKEGP